MKLRKVMAWTLASAMFAGPGYLTVAYLSLPYASASSSFSSKVLNLEGKRAARCFAIRQALW